MPVPAAPSRIEPVSFPVFAMSWYIDPGTGFSLVAYSGGGGSARTGVFNKIMIDDGLAVEPIAISTDDQVGDALKVYKNPLSGRFFLIVATQRSVRRYPLPPPPVEEGAMYSQAPYDILEIPDTMVTAIAVNSMATQLAVGCDNGLVHIYDITDDIPFHTITTPTLICEGHTNPLCTVYFSLRNNRLISSAKDGTARVWNCSSPTAAVVVGDGSSGDNNYISNAGKCIAVLSCSIDDDSPPPAKNKKVYSSSSKKPPQILVRGCAFADLDGYVALTVASGRRGKAFVSQWVQQNQQQQQQNDDVQFDCVRRTACSENPISSMSLSDDGMLLALGSVRGSILLWDIQEWKVLKAWNEVHDFPVTCICARPYAVPLLPGNEQETNVLIHARSASADSKLACLSLQRHVPKQAKQNGASGIGVSWARFLWTLVIRIFILIGIIALFYIFTPVIQEARTKCGHHVSSITSIDQIVGPFQQCFINDFLLAPPSRPGISSPLY